MITSRPTLRRCSAASVLAAFLILTVSATCAARGPRRVGMQTAEAAQALPHPLPSIPSPPDQPDVNPPPLTPKQQREILKSKYEKLKQEATELADLAKSLQQDLDKSNSDVLSLRVVDRADKIEKLAKKIKNEAVQ
jgi:hypothetical protein